MPTYVFKDKETGEISEIVLRMSELDQYKEDNPNLETQLQSSKFVGSQTDMLTKAGDGWKSVQGMENLSNNAPSIIYYKGTDFYLKLR